MASSPQEVLVACRQHDVKAVALHVTDILGSWHRLTIPVSRLNEESFEDGFAWTLHRPGQRRAEVSDVLLLPLPSTAFVEPLAGLPTLSMLCAMHDPLTREELPEDPRAIALKAEKYARESGVADEIMFALKVEFFLFDLPPHRRSKGNTLRGQAADAMTDTDNDRTLRVACDRRSDDDFRNEIMHALHDCGVSVRSHRKSRSDRHKSNIELGETSLVVSADHFMVAKHIIKRLAERSGKSATFMPFPQAGRQPAGLSAQLSLLKHENCVLSGSGYAGLSDVGLNAIGGILKHAGAVVALTNSTTNSYARLGFHAGALPQVAYSQSDLQAAVRIPSHQLGKTKCLEFAPPDGACNPYLAFSALLMAAVDGIQNKIHPGPALEPDPYADSSAALTSYPRVPASLEAALTALEEDGEFLLRGDVLSPEVLESWIQHKRMVDIQALRSQPHPREISAYYDV